MRGSQCRIDLLPHVSEKPHDRRQSLQHSCHRPGDVRQLDKVQLPLKGGLVIRVESHREPGQYPQTGLLNNPCLVDVIAAQGLELSRFL